MLLRARTVASARGMLSAGIVGSAFSTAISISAAFDAGNIKVVSTSATKAVLEIKPDPLTELEQKAHLQWFYFRATASEPG